jgi:hypothetical protein
MQRMQVGPTWFNGRGPRYPGFLQFTIASISATDANVLEHARLQRTTLRIADSAGVSQRE